MLLLMYSRDDVFCLKGGNILVIDVYSKHGDSIKKVMVEDAVWKRCTIIYKMRYGDSYLRQEYFHNLLVK